jgi:hypothetical protein
MLKPENFTYWLQGFFEISGATTLNEEQVKIVKEHLEMFFEKVVVSPRESALSKFITTTTSSGATTSLIC